LSTLYNLLAEVLNNPFESFNASEGKKDCEEEQTHCLQIIKQFTFYYSKESDSSMVNHEHFNMHSKKTDIISVKKMFCFDKIQEGRKID